MWNAKPFLACQAKGLSCHTKIQPLPKYLREKKRVKCEVPLATMLQKRPVKITMYLELDIIIKLKSTTNFDICAILNVLNYLTKKVLSLDMLIHNYKLIHCNIE